MPSETKIFNTTEVRNHGNLGGVLATSELRICENLTGCGQGFG